MKSLKLLLAASCLTAFISGCGGSSDSGSSPSPNPNPNPSPTTNQAPSVSITGDSEALEQTAISLKANATDSDGNIASYSWSITSGPTATLNNSTTSDVSFTTPEVTQDTPMVLSVTVTDDDGASATATKNFTVKRLVRSVTLTGVVTDAPIANAALTVYVGDESFPTTAGTDGTYTIQLDVDDSAVNKLVRIKANGGPDQENVEFYSQLESFASVTEQAGGDGVVNSTENFGVNITNVTTAEYALVTNAVGGVPQTASELNNALVGVDANEKLTLSALIKLVVDGSGDKKFSLPQGVNNTFQLVSSQTATAELTNTINDDDPTLIEKTKEAIKNDDKLVDNGEGSIAGSYLIGSTRYFRSHFTELTLNEDGTGTFTDHTSGAITWTQATNGAVSVVFGDGIFSPRHSCKNSEGMNFTCYSRYKTATFSIYDDNSFAKAISLTGVRDEIKTDDDTVLNADVSETEDFTMVVRGNTINPAAAQFQGSWHFDQMYYLMGGETGNEYYQPQTSKMMFNQDGSGKSTLPDGTERDFSWQISGNNLVVMLAKTDAMEAQTLTYWMLKSLQGGFQFWALTNDAVATTPDKMASMTHRRRTGIMMPEQEITLNDSMVLGRLTSYFGANLLQDSFFFDNYINGTSFNGLVDQTSVWELDGRRLSINNYYDSMANKSVYQCPEGADPQVCRLNSSNIYDVIAIDGDSWYLRNQLTIINSSDPGSTYLLKYAKSNSVLTSFEYAWLQYRQFILLNSNSEIEYKYYIHETNDMDMTKRVIRDDNFSEVGTFSVKNGKLHSDISGSVTVSDLKGFDRDYIKVCNYPLDTNCDQGEESTYYLNGQAANKASMIQPPVQIYTTAMLKGAWYDPNEPDFVVVIRDGKWVHMELKSDDTSDAMAGLEVGYADWDESTGEFTVDMIFDSNGSYGFDSALKHIITIDGNTLTIDVEGEPSFTLTRLTDANNPLVGAFVEYPLDQSRIWVTAFMPGNKFFEADFESEDPARAGINYGSFTYDASTGKTELTFELNQLADSDTMFAMFLNGDVIQWKDGDDLGIVQRVKPMSGQPMFDSHSLMYERFALINGAQTMYIELHANNSLAEVVTDGKTRAYTWSVNQGQLELLANTPSAGLSAEGYVISPSSKLNDGWKVSVLKMMEPDPATENDAVDSYMRFDADMRR